jgi:hypothetical protein
MMMDADRILLLQFAAPFSGAGGIATDGHSERTLYKWAKGSR